MDIDKLTTKFKSNCFFCAKEHLYHKIYAEVHYNYEKGLLEKKKKQ